jgi:hypothetical protein
MIAIKALFDSLTLRHRYDYFPSIKQFVLRMPTAIHEIVIRRVAREIILQLNSIAARNDASGEFAGNIEDSGSTRLTFPGSDYGPHDPDASFRHLGARYPGVIIEVSYSQKRKDLPRLADDYILGSDGNIRAVIGLDIEYRGKMATLSVWRPRFSINEDGEEELEAEQTVVNQVCLVIGPILNILTSVRDSVTKMVDQIWTHKQPSIFILKTLLQELYVGDTRAYKVIFPSLSCPFVYTLTMPRLHNRQSVKRKARVTL